MFPPELAVVAVIEPKVVVVTVGRSATLMFSIELALPVALYPVTVWFAAPKPCRMMRSSMAYTSERKPVLARNT